MNFLKNGCRKRVAGLWIFAAILAAGLIVKSNAAAEDAAVVKDADSSPDYSKYTTSYHLPFANKVDYGNLRTLHVRVSINGGPPMNLQADTGSVGVIIGAADVPNIVPNSPPGSILYTSSGVELDGVWTPATLTFLDSRDAEGHVATATIPILAATQRKTTGIGVNAGNAKPTVKQNPKVYMMGIGFGRGKDGHPEKNPFICLNEMQAGSMRRGYTITHEGITLGLAGEKVGSGYVYQKLKERPVTPETAAMMPGLKDWETTPGTVMVNGNQLPMGLVLMDTGLTNFIMHGPGGPADESANLPAGTNITVDLLSGRLHYSFKVGDKTNPATPSKVNWLKPTTNVTVNTGLRALSLYDYLYDADGGYLGLRPTTNQTPQP